MSWTVYMLRCADSTLYVGITKDPQRRLHEHNHDNRKGARYTRARRPVTLVYQEQQPTRSSASRREHELKKLTRRKKLMLLESAYHEQT